MSLMHHNVVLMNMYFCSMCGTVFAITDYLVFWEIVNCSLDQWFALSLFGYFWRLHRY